MSTAKKTNAPATRPAGKTVKVKVRKIGNSVGVLLPAETVKRLHLANGDEVFITDTPDGIAVTPYDPDFEDAMAAFEVTRKKYRNAFRHLAK